MNKAIVKLIQGYKGTGYITLSDGINHYTLNCSKGFIEVPSDIAKKLESDPRVIVEYPDGTITEKPVKASKKKAKKLTKTAIKDMDKKEQVDLLRELGAKNIPVLESGRIKMILKLQGKSED